MTYRHARRCAVVVLAFVGACDVPTGIPNWEQTWNVPAKSTTISVGTLLPNGVSITADSSAFSINVSSASVTRQLGQDCAACVAANGLTVPKPAFTLSASSSTAIPSSVVSAALQRDTLTLTIQNGFNFDPLRPSASARGYLVTSVTNGGTVVGRDSVNGAMLPMPPGQSFVRRIPLSGTVSGIASLQVGVLVNSPPGDPVTINSSQAVTVTGSVGTFLVSSAQVKVQDQSIHAAPMTFDLTSIGSLVSSRVRSGTLYLTISNPFGVQGGATLTVSAPLAGWAQSRNVGGPPYTITKPLSLSNATTSNVSVAFTPDDLRNVLGSSATIQLSGSVSGPSGVVTVTPKQVVAVSTRLEVVVSTESNK